MFRRCCVRLAQATVTKRPVLLHNYNCWSCRRELTKKQANQFFCPCERKKILPVDTGFDYFELFDLETNYTVDTSRLTKKFRELMRKLHPDLFTLKSEQEKKYSADHASQLNKAYNILMNPIERGLYMLELKHVDYEKESYALVTPECKKPILMEVLELNEQIDEITSSDEVDELDKKLNAVIKPLEKELADAFAANNTNEAIRIIVKMKYFQNVYERLADLKLKFNLNEY